MVETTQKSDHLWPIFRVMNDYAKDGKPGEV